MLRENFRKYDHLLVDLDGVVWIGEKPIEDAIHALNAVKDSVRVTFVTNNSTRHRNDVVKRLRDIGINWVTVDDIVTSASALAELISSLGIRKCYVIGEAGLVQELQERGVELDEEADAVCVGMDRGFTYDKISIALRNLLKGALFMATNSDSTFPTEEGLMPGAGAMVAAIAAASGREPDVIIGKPNPLILMIAARGSSNPLVIGDRVETDILGAIRAGMDSVLVLTGVTKDLKGVGPRPKFIVESLKGLLL